MTSEWIATQGRAGARGFDTDTALDAVTVRQLRHHGYTFCLRYLPIDPTWTSTSDLTKDEVQRILDSGLALMPVQHVRMPGWAPTRILGLNDGHLARVSALRAGIPAHVNVWLDVEGITESTDHLDIADYINAWYDVVSAWGYIPGIYVGAQSLLTSAELYLSLKMEHYWKSGSDVPTPGHRGYQMVQTHLDVVRCGIEVDEDVTQRDAFGDSVQWLMKKA